MGSGLHERGLSVLGASKGIGRSICGRTRIGGGPGSSWPAGMGEAVLPCAETVAAPRTEVIGQNSCQHSDMALRSTGSQAFAETLLGH